MTYAQDDKKAALTAQGFSGSVPDMVLQWLNANGATSNNIPDANYQMLVAQGATPGAVGDMWQEVLLAKGYAGNLQSMLAQFWSAGGTFGYDGTFIPFGANDDAVVFSQTLLSSSDVGAGVPQGVEGVDYEFDAVNGFRALTDTAHILWDDNLVVDNTVLDNGVTFQFEVDLAPLAATPFGTVEYPFEWLDDGGTTGYLQLGSLNTEGVSCRIRFTNGASTGFVYISNVNKAGKTHFRLSIDSLKCALFVDGYWALDAVSADYTTANRVTKAYISGLSLGSHTFSGFVSYFQVENKEVALDAYAPAPVIVSIGDSVPAGGNHDGEAAQKWNGLDTSATPQGANFYDRGCIPELIRVLAAKGKHPDVWSYADTTDSVTVTGTNDVMSQIDGTGAFDALEFSPTKIFLHAGYNDTNNVTPAPDFTPTGDFKVSYQDLIDKILERHPTVGEIVCFTNHSREQWSSSQVNRDETDAVNARIAEVVAANPECTLADWFTHLGGHLLTADNFYDGLHLSELGQVKKGQFMETYI